MAKTSDTDRKFEESKKSFQMKNIILETDQSFKAERSIRSGSMPASDKAKLDAMYKTHLENLIAVKDGGIDDLFTLEAVHIEGNRELSIHPSHRENRAALEGFSFDWEELEPLGSSQEAKSVVQINRSRKTKRGYSATSPLGNYTIEKIGGNECRLKCFDLAGVYGAPEMIEVGDYKRNEDNVSGDDTMVDDIEQAKVAARFHYGNSLTKLGLKWQNWPELNEVYLGESSQRNWLPIELMGFLSATITVMREQPDIYRDTYREAWKNDSVDNVGMRALADLQDLMVDTYLFDDSIIGKVHLERYENLKIIEDKLIAMHEEVLGSDKVVSLDKSAKNT